MRNEALKTNNFSLIQFFLLTIKTNSITWPNIILREMVLREPHGFEADMWSLGCVLYTMLVGKSAFGGRDVQNTFEKIALAELEIPSSKVPYEASDLIKRLIEPVKEKRMQLHG